MMNKLHAFKTDISGITLPSKFTYPFFYTPHPLSEIAAKELQEYLIHQTDFVHDFGLSKEETASPIGKMFGVLVVQNPDGELGYLAAFSGKLANSNDHDFFVPPVFDLLVQHGFFLQEEKYFYGITERIEALEKSEEYGELQRNIEQLKRQEKEEVKALKQKIKVRKIERDQLRDELLKTLSGEELQMKFAQLDEQSRFQSLALKKLKRHWKVTHEKAQNNLDVFEQKIQILKEERKERSAILQQKIFESYMFRNAKGEQASVLDIFSKTVMQVPPAGAGECAAPKLLEFAFNHHLKPIALAEFWWGKSPKSEVRQHQNFYPACKGKCEPILGHMLKGLEVEDNPLLVVSNSSDQLEIIYEDDDLIVVNKPPELLSVPGRTIEHSVYSILRKKYPEIADPILVHRLDMSTSGIILGTKNERSHAFIQRQFIQRTARKRYVAILDGILTKENGYIELPLAQDFENRPRQKVDPIDGKRAITYFERIEVKNKQTRVYFYPKTGRTHQLRMHAAHEDGIGLPIVGDDLYGKPSNRLCLHAERLEIVHPTTKKTMVFEIEAPF